MPSPYAHILAAITIATPYLVHKADTLRHKEDILTLIAFSLVPDLDVIPGLLFGNIADYHNHMTHSIAFGLMVCLFYSLIRSRIHPPRSFRRSFSLTAAAYGLHLLMDFFTYGRGLMLFWPFTDERFSPPFLIFYGLRRSDGVFSSHHIVTFITESVKMLPILSVVWWLARRHGKTSTADIVQEQPDSGS